MDITTKIHSAPRHLTALPVSEQKPTIAELMQKVTLVQQLKKREADEVETRAEKPRRSATRAMLQKLGQDAKTYFTGYDPNLPDFVEELIAKEEEFSHCEVAYHGNRSSLLPDIYGRIVHTLLLRKEGIAAPVPRLNAKNFTYGDVEEFLKECNWVDDTCPSFQEILLAASANLTNYFHSRALENSLVFYLRGSTADRIFSAHSGLYTQLGEWGFEDKSFCSKAITRLETDFHQWGYLWQLFFHKTKTLNKLAYLSHPLGRVIREQKGPQSVLEYLQALRSEELEDEMIYRLEEVQYRILADPRIFTDTEEVSIFCYRCLPIDEQTYYKRIQKEIVDPIIQEGLKKSGPGGLFGVSPLAQTLGTRPPLARLADYVLLGTDDPRVWVVYGNEEAVAQSLRSGQITPLDKAPDNFTLLELSLMARQQRIFEILFACFVPFAAKQTGDFIERLLLLAYRFQEYSAISVLLDLEISSDVQKQLLTSACRDNQTELILKLVVKIIKSDLSFLKKHPDFFDFWLEECFKNQNFECIDAILLNCKEHITKPLLYLVINNLLPSQLKKIVPILEKHHYNIEELERFFLETDSFIQTEKLLVYKKYYSSLSIEEKKRLPFKRFWPLLSLLGEKDGGPRTAFKDIVLDCLKTESIAIVRSFARRVFNSRAFDAILGYCLSIGNLQEALLTIKVLYCDQHIELIKIIPHCKEAENATLREIAKALGSFCLEKTIIHCLLNDYLHQARALAQMNPVSQTNSSPSAIVDCLSELERTLSSSDPNFVQALITFMGMEDSSFPETLANRLFEHLHCLHKKKGVAKPIEGYGRRAFIQADNCQSTREEKLEAIRLLKSEYLNF